MNNYKNQLADELYKAVKELNECLNSPKLDDVLQRYEEQKDRATGRTTILYMKAIVKALENPGMVVEFIDHSPHTNYAITTLHMMNIQDIIKKLKYNISIYRKTDNRIFLSNKFGK